MKTLTHRYNGFVIKNPWRVVYEEAVGMIPGSWTVYDPEWAPRPQRYYAESERAARHDAARRFRAWRRSEIERLRAIKAKKELR